MILDVTGVELIPGDHGCHCPGNGTFPGIECCCDECDYMLLCFPDWEKREDDKNCVNFRKNT